VSFGAPTHELALGVTGINPWFGTCVNPVDTRARPRRVFERVGLLADGLTLEAAAWRSFR
jgi:hypothetical protein